RRGRVAGGGLGRRPLPGARAGERGGGGGGGGSGSGNARVVHAVGRQDGGRALQEGTRERVGQAVAGPSGCETRGDQAAPRRRRAGRARGGGGGGLGVVGAGYRVQVVRWCIHQPM